MQDEEFGTLAEGAALNNGLMVAAVLLILWRALRWGRLIVAVMANMIVGLALTAAAGLAMVGVLNPISVAFAVLFVGIGVDFGIQFAVRYREERFQHLSLDKALDKAGAGASLPLALAAAATAAGFFSFIPTAYRGVSELGLIAGVGMILAFCSSVTLLPALLAILKPPAETTPVGYAFLAPIDRFQTGHRKLIVSVAIGLAILGAPLLTKVRFDINPLNLRSAKVESVATMLELTSDPRNAPNTIEILAEKPGRGRRAGGKTARPARSRDRVHAVEFRCRRTRSRSLRPSRTRANCWGRACRCGQWRRPAMARMSRP